MSSLERSCSDNLPIFRSGRSGRVGKHEFDCLIIVTQCLRMEIWGLNIIPDVASYVIPVVQMSLQPTLIVEFGIPVYKKTAWWL